MVGKKRKLKKDLKRKLKKDIKKNIKKKENKDTKYAESKVEKQVIDNQTLQQIMMAQMMNSRSRVSNGENTSWIATQNQKYADEIQHRKELNAMKEKNKELKRQASNIEENEKFIEMKEKYENEEKMLKNKIVELNEAKEQAVKIKPLTDEVERLKKEKEELLKELNSPERKLQIQAEELNAQIEYLNKQIKDGNKKEIQELAKHKEALKILIKRKEIIEHLEKITDEETQITSQLKILLKPLRDIFPDLKGKSINSQKLYDNATDLINEITNKIDYYNQQIEKINENKKMLQTLIKTKETYDIYEENIRKEHPILEMIYEEKLRAHGENITNEDKEKLFNESLIEYKTKFIDNNNDNPDYKPSKLPVNDNEEDNPDYKPSKLPVNDNEEDDPDYKVFELPVDNNDYTTSSSDNEYVTLSNNNKDDKLDVAHLGPGTE